MDKRIFLKGDVIDANPRNDWHESRQGIALAGKGAPIVDDRESEEDRIVSAPYTAIAPGSQHIWVPHE